MRSTTALFALAHLACALLIVNAAVMFHGLDRPTAHGQGAAAAGNAALATAVTPSGEVFVFVYDEDAGSLLGYQLNGATGLWPKGFRRLTWDAQLEEFFPESRTKRTSVKEIREQVQKAQQAQAQAQQAQQGQGQQGAAGSGQGGQGGGPGQGGQTKKAP